MSPVDKEKQAVLVGVGRCTQRKKGPFNAADRLSPLGLAVEAANRASRDTGLGEKEAEKLLEDLVAIGTMGMFYEMRWISKFKKKPYKNFSRSIANRVGAKPDKKFTWRSFPYGNGPQFMVSQFAQLISSGEIPQGPILIGGAEACGSFDTAVRAGKHQELKELKTGERNYSAGWDDGDNKPEDKPKVVNRFARDDAEKYELFIQTIAHGIMEPLTVYPMFENAYRRNKGRNLKDHMRLIGDLFHRFSVVAAAQPEHAWYPEEKSIDEIITVTERNRMMSYPYTKNMVARDEVDQSAMIMMMSWAEAERRGIAREKLVFLHGSGDAFDEELVTLRHEFGSCKSMKAAYSEALRVADLDINKPEDIDKVKVFDFYSCFPIAVEQACDALGLDGNMTDVTRITATGGLPYHGGPGGNYSSHAICAIVEKLRTDYFRGELGMVCANGGMLTEHSVGIYSTEPPKNTFERRDHNLYAPDYALPLSQYAKMPTGKGRILTWTVEFKKKPNIPGTGIIIGEMTSGPDKGKRFCANTREDDTRTLNWLLAKCRIGEEVAVECTGKETKMVRSIAETEMVSFSAPPNAAL